MTSTTARQGLAPARGWLRGIRFSWFSFVMLGLVVLAVLVLSPTIRVLAQQQTQITKLEGQNAAKQAQVDALDKQATQWQDPEYVKAEARARLLYVMPGETSYLIIDDLPRQTAAQKQKVSAKVQQSSGDWASTLLDSLLLASASGSGAGSGSTK